MTGFMGAGKNWHARPPVFLPRSGARNQPDEPPLRALSLVYWAGLRVPWPQHNRPVSPQLRASWPALRTACEAACQLRLPFRSRVYSATGVRMKLLVTNDDGINSVFLHELIFALKAAGHEPYVVAPASEQSWTGASKTRGRPVKSA